MRQTSSNLEIGREHDNSMFIQREGCCEWLETWNVAIRTQKTTSKLIWHSQPKPLRVAQTGRFPHGSNRDFEGKTNIRVGERLLQG